MAFLYYVDDVLLSSLFFSRSDYWFGNLEQYMCSGPGHATTTFVFYVGRFYYSTVVVVWCWLLLLPAAMQNASSEAAWLLSACWVTVERDQKCFRVVTFNT